VTSPLVLSAWIWNGASSDRCTPRMRSARVALRVDLVAPGRHDRADVAAARAQLEPVGRALARRVTSPDPELARSEKPQNAVAEIVPEPVLT
jgi:hypothetical protein